MATEIEAVRLDKWLWAARFYKTRSIARNMVDGGKVHYNGQRSKPSKAVELGAIVTLRQGQPLLTRLQDHFKSISKAKR